MNQRITERVVETKITLVDAAPRIDADHAEIVDIGAALGKPEDERRFRVFYPRMGHEHAHRCELAVESGLGASDQAIEVRIGLAPVGLDAQNLTVLRHEHLAHERERCTRSTDQDDEKRKERTDCAMDEREKPTGRHQKHTSKLMVLTFGVDIGPSVKSRMRSPTWNRRGCSMFAASSSRVAPGDIRIGWAVSKTFSTVTNTRALPKR